MGGYFEKVTGVDIPSPTVNNIKDVIRPGDVTDWIKEKSDNFSDWAEARREAIENW
jgi:hypothetical protein